METRFEYCTILAVQDQSLPSAPPNSDPRWEKIQEFRTCDHTVMTWRRPSMEWLNGSKVVDPAKERAEEEIVRRHIETLMGGGSAVVRRRGEEVPLESRTAFEWFLKSVRDPLAPYPVVSRLRKE